jgi:transposase-like protein
VKFERFQDIPAEVIEEALSLIDRGLQNYKIADALGVSSYYLNKIRKEHGRTPSQGNKIYTEEQKQQMIDLLREGGRTCQGISEITGVPTQTLRNWRHREVEEGNDLPEFERVYLDPPVNTKYSDEELIELIILNPGFGLERMLRVLYPKSKSVRNQRFRVTMLLNDYKDFTGEDLYEFIQDPSFSRWVSEHEYKEITGNSRVPKGSGRATGGRPSKVSESYGAGTKNVGDHRNIPLPPQKFNWGPYQFRE